MVYSYVIAFHFVGNGWQAITYRVFASMVSATASYLIKTGITKGDRIGLFSENRPEWCASYLGIVAAGGVAVPIDSQLGADEANNLLSDADARIVFHSERTGLNLDLYASRKAGETPVRLVSFDSPAYANILGTPHAEELPDVQPEDLASIIYTSGTTGKPKGVMLDHHNFASDASAVINAGIVSHGDNVLAMLPLHHTYAFMCTFLVPLLLGASVTYPASLKGSDLMGAIKDRPSSVRGNCTAPNTGP